MVRTEGVLHLSPSTASVPQARAFTREWLSGLDADVVDNAELAMSELVTNAVVHARTEMEVRVEILGERVRLEIRDYSTVVPRHVAHTTRATTGRGLDMVRLLAQDWGVSLVEGDGKVIWCELSTSRALTELDEQSLLAAWPDDLEPALTALPTVVKGRTATLLNYPLARGMRDREHTNGLLRECMLLADPARDGVTTAPGQLVEIATMITSRYSALLAEPERRKIEAYDRGELSIDLTYPLPPETDAVISAWEAAFAALDAYAANNQLLTLQSTPDVTELRRWVLSQFRAQAAGQPPTPWSGTLH